MKSLRVFPQIVAMVALLVPCMTSGSDVKKPVLTQGGLEHRAADRGALADDGTLQYLSLVDGLSNATETCEAKGLARLLARNVGNATQLLLEQGDTRAAVKVPRERENGYHLVHCPDLPAGSYTAYLIEGTKKSGGATVLLRRPSSPSIKRTSFDPSTGMVTILGANLNQPVLVKFAGGGVVKITGSDPGRLVITLPSKVTEGPMVVSSESGNSNELMFTPMRSEDVLISINHLAGIPTDRLRVEVGKGNLHPVDELGRARIGMPLTSVGIANLLFYKNGFAEPPIVVGSALTYPQSFGVITMTADTTALATVWRVVRPERAVDARSIAKLGAYALKMPLIRDLAGLIRDRQLQNLGYLSDRPRSPELEGAITRAGDALFEEVITMLEDGRLAKKAD